MACLVLADIGIIIRFMQFLLLNVLERRRHISSIASVVSILASAVQKLLGGSHEVVVFDHMCALEGSRGWEGPTCSTLALIGNWGYLACSVPVDFNSKSIWSFFLKALNGLAWCLEVCIKIHDFRQCKIRESIDSPLMSLLRISIKPLNPFYILHKNDPAILLLSFPLINPSKLMLVLLKSISIASLMDV